MLEAKLGLGHITQDKHEERALAYQFVRVKRIVKKLRMGDRSGKEGQHIAAELVGDMYTPDLFDKLPANLGAKADEIERRLATEAYFAPIAVEWNRIKNPPGKKPMSKDPEWYTLFDGTDQIRTWAKKMRAVSMYLFLYKDMSSEAHAGDTVQTLVTDQGKIRPLRYPHGFHNAVQLALLWFITSFEKLTTFYDPKLGNTFRNVFLKTLHPEFHRLVVNCKKAFRLFG